jgi:type IV secretion system protein VirD4
MSAFVRLGYRVPTKDGEPLTYKNDGHLLTVAPTGAGKTRDVLVAAPLEYLGSCIVIDPKGQLAAITGKHRERMGQRVIVLNPFDILREFLGPSARFNPMAALDPSLDSFGTDCDNIADPIIVHDAGGRDNHWNESAHGLIAALIGHLAANITDPNSKNLATVRQILRRPALLQEHAKAAQDGNDEMVAEELDAFCDLSNAPNKGELSSIISTAKTQTKFLGTKAISENVSGSDFRFRELKERPTTVYLTLPTRYLATCSKWFRLVVAAALDDLLREETGVPVLVLLDEFYQLGRLKIIQNAMSLARGYGLQLWPILQDLTQLQEHYEKSWETFLGNAGVRQFFAPRENTTAEYVSKLCGETTISVTSQSKGTSENSGHGFFDVTTGKSEGTSTSVIQRRLLLPQEVCQLADDQFLLFADKGSKAVIRGYRLPYWEIPELQGKYSPDPYHKPKAKPDLVQTGPNVSPPKGRHSGFSARQKVDLSRF